MQKASLIIAFYNRTDYLEMVLAGLERQTLKGYEIIIADDGSNEQTVSQIKEILSQSELPIHHVWHEDHGFRKNRILNRAIQVFISFQIWNPQSLISSRGPII